MNEEFDDIRLLSVGDTAPEDLVLPMFHEGKDIEKELKDYGGKWKIFFFYPSDFSFVCPTELEEMADNYEAFLAENAEVFSISTDSVFVHKAWKDTSPSIKKITFPMVADPTGEISMMFNTYIFDEGVSLRGTFILNPENEIIVAEINGKGIGRSAKETLRKLRAAKFVAEHGGQVCPASWEPGDKTLEPGIDLVGKI